MMQDDSSGSFFLVSEEKAEVGVLSLGRKPPTVLPPLGVEKCTSNHGAVACLRSQPGTNGTTLQDCHHNPS